MAKVREIFELAMALTDRELDSAEKETALRRSVGLLNILQQELYRLSTDFEPAGAHGEALELKNGDSRLGLDEYLCRTVLPYGLAALLFSEDDPELAAGFEQRYRLMKTEAMAAAAVTSGQSQDLYGICEFKELGSWE